MVKTIHKVMRALLALTLLFISLNGLCRGVAFGAPANAASNVLEDLQRDESFNLDAYPEVLNDYSMQVIQIAESTDGELFVYVYQPSANAKNIIASSINIARQENNNEALNFSNYKLEYLNSSGVFYKYKVLGFGLEDSNVRYYNISNILRPFNEHIDKSPETGSISEVENAVGQLWTVSTADDMSEYSMIYSEVIEITRKYVGYVRYEAGFQMFVNHPCDSYFVAFSTDHDIDRLISADVSFNKQSYKRIIHKANGIYGTPQWEELTDFGNKVEDKVHLDYKDKGSFTGGGLGAHTYTWDKITSTQKFKTNSTTSGFKLTTEGVTDIDDTQWVLQFYEFGVSVIGGIDTLIESCTAATDVMILRLTFEKDGDTYNLGVVDNKQTGDAIQDNIKTSGFDLFIWLESVTGIPAVVWRIIIYSLPFIILLPVLSIIFPPFGQALGVVFGWIFKAVGKIIVWLLKAVWWVISRPFVWIAALIRKRKEAAPAKATPSKSRKRKTPQRRKTSHTMRRKKKT